ncbi:substrate-binding periplasmic protein [Andreprevotia chitinilytica]|uniref:substrate-binding periplasmic protein n=1 Tax=Andreprevotia chitinilytica TaxID=396808 RepID=UPI00054DFF8F|nr:transporter substrate-binding domain-containing protein [Andreprevotia chitinilytica]
MAYPARLMAQMLAVACALLLGPCSIAVADTDLRILTTEEAPANYTVQHQLTGITADIIDDLKRRLDIHTDVEVQPWARVLHTVLVRPNTLVFTLARTPERVAKGLNFIGPVTTRRHIVYKRTGAAFQVGSIADIKAQRLLVGGLRDDWRLKLMKDNGVAVDESVNHEMTIKHLMHDQVQLIVLSDLELKIDSDLAGVDAGKLEPAFVIKEAPAFIAFSKGTPPELIAKWQEAFTDFQKSDEPARLAKKWSTTLGLPIAYTPDKGFFMEH